MTNLYGNYKHRFMHILSLRPHTAFMLGGWTERDKYDVQNFWLYNQESYKFEKSYRYLQTEMYAGQWALASPHHRATQAENLVIQPTHNTRVGWTMIKLCCSELRV